MEENFEGLESTEIVRSSSKAIDQSFVKKARSYSILTAEEEQRLMKKVKGGDTEARLLFFNSNLRLVPWVLNRKFRWVFNRTNDFEPMDLIQEGILGLNIAIEKFECGIGKFSVYAVWWIFQSMQRFLANSKRTIRVPVHADEDLRKYLKAKNKHSLLYGEIDISELSKEANITVDKVLEMEQLLNQKMVSLDQRISSDEDKSYLYEMIKDPFGDRQEYDVDRSILQKRLNGILEENLSPKQINVLELRFGLNGNYPRSLEEVGQEFNVTRERIRQIQEKAFSVLRGLKCSKELFLELFDFDPYKEEKVQPNESSLIVIKPKKENLVDQEKKLLLKKYLWLAIVLNKRPNFSDIEKYSQEKYLPERFVFEKHFGSMFELWRQSGFIKSETKTIIPEKGIVSFKISFKTISELLLAS